MSTSTAFDTLSSDVSTSSAPQSTNLLGYFSAKNQSDSLILKTVSLGSTTSVDAANVDVGFQDIYKSLSISAQQIVQKLNEILKGKLPNGVESLKPEDVTPEKTADTIVTGINSLFDAYAKSNSDLSPDELVKRFFAAARKGVDQGYGEASDTLDSLGAFSVDGIQDGIKKTKSLIDSKLNDLETKIRKQLNLDTDAVSTAVASQVSSGVLGQAGAGVIATDRSSALNIAA